MPKLYTQEDFDNAIAAIKCGLSYRKASMQFGVPKSTLTDRIAGGKHKRQERIFTSQEEDGFAEYFNKLSQRECGVNSLEVRNTIKCWLDRDQRNVLRFKDNMPTSNWVTQFKKRHPLLNIKPLKSVAKPIKIKFEVPDYKYVEIVKVSPDSTQESLLERNVPSSTCQEALIDGTIPSTAMDRTIPSSEMERNIPLSAMERTIPPLVINQTIPSSAVERNILSAAAMERDIPSSSAIERNIPSSAMERNIPSPMERNIPSAMERNIPLSALERNIPSAPMERSILSSVVDQTIPPLVVNPIIGSSVVERTIAPSIVERTIPSTTHNSINTRTVQLNTGTSSTNSDESQVNQTQPEVLPTHSKNYIALKALEATLSEHEQNIFHRRFEESHSLEVEVMYIAWKVLKHRCLNESPTMVNDYLRSEKRVSYSQKLKEVIPNPVAEETMIQLQEIINKYQDVDVEKKPSVIVSKSDINNL